MGKVVSIRSAQPVDRRAAEHITQERLRRGLDLLDAQRRVLEELHKFKLDMEKDLAAGAEPEEGELTFDRDLRIVRPRGAGRGRILQVSIR